VGLLPVVGEPVGLTDAPEHPGGEQS